MKTRLKWISPSDLALLTGVVGLIASIPIVIFAFVAIGPGRTVNMNGFVSLSFTGSLSPLGLVFAFPLMNATVGWISGLVTAWLYNFLSKFLGGVSIRIE
jgi:hypothetical protein